MSKEIKELFLENDYQKEFTAKIIDINSLGLVFDQTLFYPTGGHQAHDKGNIILESGEEIEILDVMKNKEGIIYHKIKDYSNIVIGQKIIGKIDWKRRNYHMRLHTAQHLLSQIIQEMYKINTIRSNFDYDDPMGGLLKIEKSISINEWQKVEIEANKRIKENFKIKRKTEGKIFEILIDGKFPNKCGGTHIKKLGEIERLRIIRVEGDKIHYEIPPRLTEKENEIIWVYHDVMKYIPPNLFNKSDEYLKELHQRVEKLDRKNKDLKDHLIKSSLTLGEANEEIKNNIKIIFVNLSFLQAKEIKSLFKEYKKEESVYFALGAKNTLCIQNFSNKASAKDIFNLFKNEWNMKGGGNKDFAQGGTLPEDEDILKRIKDLTLEFEIK